MAGLGRRGAAVHEAVLAATLREIESGGLDMLTVAAVAARAGVHETSVYRRFQTRENLVLEALLAESEQRVPVPDTGSLRGDLTATLTLASAATADPLGLAVMRSGTLAHGDYAEERRRFWASRIETFTPVVERAVARGEVAADVDTSLLLEMLVAIVHSRALVTGFPLEDDLPERVVDALLDGVPRPG
ncbi:TetR-like C-terminal domain-containing protein [Nocardioides speluncae]|uniref:TetR-like C-terminal domain-containing protein n=1 Tax=Nocardioides speluncae TaxID=2670337 RepID=UPI000D693CB3|nr:TetR-like C-terminal domain-containing protein [Nocardioides speluncae]